MAKATSTLLDHILTNANQLVSNSGVLDIGLSDHQLVFCTRKNKKSKKIINIKLSKQEVKKNILQIISVINLTMLTLPITLNLMM